MAFMDSRFRLPMTWLASLSKQHGTTLPSHVATAPCHMRQHSSFNGLRSTHFLTVVATVFAVACQQWMPVTGVVQLRGFEDQLMHAHFAGHALDFRDVMFVGLHHQELPNDVGSTLRRTRGLQDVPGAFQNAFELAADAVRGIGFLAGSIDGHNEAGLHQALGALRREVVGVGGCRSVNAMSPAGVNQPLELGMQQGFPLKVQVAINQRFGHAMDPCRGILNLR